MALPAPNQEVPDPSDSAFDLRRLALMDATRFVKIVFTFARRGLFVAARKGPLIMLRPRQQAPAAMALALRQAFTDLGPTFVKFGQLMASSPGLFPDAVTSEFRQLLDAVPEEPSVVTRAVIEQDLGRSIDELFASFENQPIAAASVAQVHEARLHNGTRVAVKVQRPNLRKRIERDLRLMWLLAGVLQRAGAIGQMAQPVAIIEDFAASLSRELDFRNEVVSMRAFTSNLHSFGHNDLMVVPTPMDGMYGPNVIVMTFVEGLPIDDVATLRAQGHDLLGVGLQGVRAWLEAALRHGLFHGDVHAGNLFVTTDGRIAFLDFGIMGELSEDSQTMLRDTIPAALPAIVLQDQYHRVGEILEALGAGEVDPAHHEPLANDIRVILGERLNRPLAEVSYGEILIDIIRIASRYRLHLPRDLILVCKQLIYFEGYARRIAPEINILAEPQLLQDLLGGLVADELIVQLPFMLTMLTPAGTTEP